MFQLGTRELGHASVYYKWMFLFLCRALQQVKLRLKGAQKGHSLLKKKADALTLRFRQILTKIIEVNVYFTLYSIYHNK